MPPASYPVDDHDIWTSDDGTMRAPSTDEASLVRAAQAGDRRALDELVAACLPLVYNIVGRALSGHPDADDIVQETMLRAIRDLGSLRTPRSFRSWLAAIAVHQVSTHLRRMRTVGRRTATLDEAEGLPATFEDLTILRLGLSGQRRDAVLASRWLDADDRALLSLWWLETAGQLTRPELAAATGLTVAHAGVRVQRMLDHLELSRAVVAALGPRRRCPGLDAVAAGWDGRPSPLWRKRMGRHVRACTVCARASEDTVPAARLLFGVALVPVPVTLTAALVGKTALSGPAGPLASTAAVSGAGGAGAKAGLLGQLTSALGVHPAAAMIVAGALVAGAVVAVALPTRPSGPPESFTARAPASPGPRNTARPVALGPVSLESANAPGRFVSHVGDLALLARTDSDTAAQARQAATFEVVEGLADRRCVSLRSRDGRYLRHSSWRLRLAANSGTVLFRGDATFCARAGSTADSVSLESFNYPGRFLRHAGDALWVDPSDGTGSFRADSSFRVRPPLAG